MFVEADGTKTQVFREYGTAFVDRARWVKAGTPLTEATRGPLVLTRVQGPIRLEGDDWRRGLERRRC